MNTRALLALAITLLACSPAHAATDLCAGRFPAGLQGALERAVPGFRLPRSSDNSAEDVAYHLSQHGSGCLGASSGDFDGDGGKDYLVAMTSVDGARTTIVVALKRDAGWDVETISTWPEGRARLYVEAGAPGRYERTEALDGPVDAEGGEVLALSCRHDVVIWGGIESSGVAFCRQKATWRHVWISD